MIDHPRSMISPERARRMSESFDDVHDYLGVRLGYLLQENSAQEFTHWTDSDVAAVLTLYRLAYPRSPLR